MFQLRSTIDQFLHNVIRRNKVGWKEETENESSMIDGKHVEKSGEMKSGRQGVYTAYLLCSRSCRMGLSATVDFEWSAGLDVPLLRVESTLGDTACPR